MPVEILDSGDGPVAGFLARFRAMVLELFFRSAEKKDDAEYAVLELLNNAVEHGNHFDKGKKIRVEWTVHGGKLAVSVEDEGLGFGARAPFLEPPAGSRRGRGLWSIQADVYRLEFNERGNRATVIFESDGGTTDMKPVYFDGRLIVVRATEVGAAGLRVLTELLAGFDREFTAAPAGVPVHFIVDISPCPIPTSMFLGFLGYMADDQKRQFRDIVIVGASDETQKRLRQFGLLPSTGNMQPRKKIHLVPTVEQGITWLLSMQGGN